MSERDFRTDTPLRVVLNPAMRCCRRWVLFLAMSFAAAVLAASPAAGQAWPQEQSDIPPSPRVTFGRLDNGLRYAILPNQTPPGAVSLRLLVLSGSLDENADELGYAHFVEHMAFSGTTHFPAGELVKILQRLGATFGPHINAETTPAHTLYRLDLPENSAVTVDVGLRVLRDFADGILFEPAQINLQRGVILNEKLSRQTSGQADDFARDDFVFQGTLIPERRPLGTDRAVSFVRRERLRAFYNAWYRPERMVLVVAGDIPAAKVASMVQQVFASLARRGPASPEPEVGLPAGPSEMLQATHGERRQGVQIELGSLRARPPAADTVADHVERLALTTACGMLQRRLQVRQEQPGRPITDSAVLVTQPLEKFDQLRLIATGSTAGWKTALAVAEQELRRAAEDGFDPTELAGLRESLRAQAEAAAKISATIPTSELAARLVDDTEKGLVFWLPEEFLPTILRSIDQLTVEDCRRALRAAWGDSRHYLFVRIPSDYRLSPRELARAYDASLAVAIQPPTAVNRIAFAAGTPGPPGVVTERQHVADLDLWLVRFANGVALNVKHTDFTRGIVCVSVRLGTGSLEEPIGKPGLRVWTGSLLGTFGGLGRYSPEELKRALDGRNIHVDLRAEDDAFHFRGYTTDADFPVFLSFATAHLTEPGFRPEATESFRSFLSGLYNSLEQSSNGAIPLLIFHILGRSDPRMGLPKRYPALSYSISDLQRWIQPTLKSGCIEIAVVGDIDPNLAIDEVGRTFGALPPRLPKPDLSAERRLNFPAPPARRVLIYVGTGRPTTLAFYWPVHPACTVADRRHLRLLADICEDRLRVQIRDALGATYSPTAGVDFSDTYPGFADIHCQLDVKPDQERKIAGLVNRVASDLAAHGVTDDELQRAKAQAGAQSREAAYGNDYWLDAVMADCQERPARLDEARTLQRDFTAAAKADIDALAARYLRENNLFQFVIRARQRSTK